MNAPYSSIHRKTLIAISSWLAAASCTVSDSSTKPSETQPLLVDIAARIEGSAVSYQVSAAQLGSWHVASAEEALAAFFALTERGYRLGRVGTVGTQQTFECEGDACIAKAGQALGAAKPRAQTGWRGWEQIPGVVCDVDDAIDICGLKAGLAKAYDNIIPGGGGVQIDAAAGSDLSGIDLANETPYQFNNGQQCYVAFDASTCQVNCNCGASSGGPGNDPDLDDLPGWFRDYVEEEGAEDVAEKAADTLLGPLADPDTLPDVKFDEDVPDWLKKIQEGGKKKKKKGSAAGAIERALNIKVRDLKEYSTETMLADACREVNALPQEDRPTSPCIFVGGASYAADVERLVRALLRSLKDDSDNPFTGFIDEHGGWVLGGAAAVAALSVVGVLALAARLKVFAIELRSPEQAERPEFTATALRNLRNALTPEHDQLRTNALEGVGSWSRAARERAGTMIDSFLPGGLHDGLIPRWRDRVSDAFRARELGRRPAFETVSVRPHRFVP